MTSGFRDTRVEPDGSLTSGATVVVIPDYATPADMFPGLAMSSPEAALALVPAPVAPRPVPELVPEPVVLVPAPELAQAPVAEPETVLAPEWARTSWVDDHMMRIMGGVAGVGALAVAGVVGIAVYVLHALLATVAANAAIVAGVFVVIALIVWLALSHRAGTRADSYGVTTRTGRFSLGRAAGSTLTAGSTSTSGLVAAEFGSTATATSMSAPVTIGGRVASALRGDRRTAVGRLEATATETERATALGMDLAAALGIELGTVSEADLAAALGIELGEGTDLATELSTALGVNLGGVTETELAAAIGRDLATNLKVDLGSAVRSELATVVERATVTTSTFSASDGMVTAAGSWADSKRAGLTEAGLAVGLGAPSMTPRRSAFSARGVPLLEPLGLLTPVPTYDKQTAAWLNRLRDPEARKLQWNGEKRDFAIRMGDDMCAIAHSFPAIGPDYGSSGVKWSGDEYTRSSIAHMNRKYGKDVMKRVMELNDGNTPLYEIANYIESTLR